MVTVIGAQSKNGLGFKLTDTNRIGDVPYFFYRWSGLVAQMVDARMPVVDFEKTLVGHGGKILSGDGPTKIRMVQVNQNRLAILFGLLLDSAKIVIDGLFNGLTTDGLNDGIQVRSVHVDGNALRSVADFFGFDE